jgi:hypothetical protein
MKTIGVKTVVLNGAPGGIEKMNAYNQLFCLVIYNKYFQLV